MKLIPCSLVCALLVALFKTIDAAAPLFLPSTPASATETSKKVLVFYTEGKNIPANINIDKSIQAALKSGSTDRIDYYSEHMDLSRFPNDRFRQELRDFYRVKYANLKLDLIIACGGSGLSDLVKDAKELFPGTPIVFCTVERPSIGGRNFGPHVTGVIGKIEYSGTLNLALSLQPDTRRVVVVGGAAFGDQLFMAQARQELREYEGRVEFTYLSGLPMKELLTEVSRLPEYTIIYYISVIRDGAGVNFTGPEALSIIARSANKPIYSSSETYIGDGIIGGHVFSFEILGNKAAEMGLRILGGENPAAIPIIYSGMNLYMFDWRQLRRWGISERKLPPGSDIRYRELSAWEQYKWRIIGIVALCIIQALLIGGLLAERKRRQQAKSMLAESFRLEEMISEFSATLINLPVTHIEAEVDHALSRINRFLGLDRTVVFEISLETNSLRVIHTWQDGDVAPLPADLNASRFDWTVAKLLGGEMVVFEKTTDLPAEAAALKEYCTKLGIKSGVILPLTQRENTLIGTSFMAMRAEQSWPDELVRQLRVIGDTCVSALERKHAEQTLRESEERFRTMADTTPVMIWMSGADKLCTFFNRPWLEFTGRTMEQELGNGWAEGVHREDLQRCVETYAGSFDARLDFRMEYRLRRSDGEYRWIMDLGVPRYTPDGDFAGYIGSCLDFTEHRRSEEDLRNALFEVERLRDQLQEENIYLQEEIKLSHNFDEIVGNSDALKYVLFKVEQVAPTDTIVLLLGETGTGKELFARAIHQASPRKDRPLVKVNCAALPATLIESELFGHEKGAFTGASARKIGRFELANGGTLFLDEIGELPLELQPKLLRVLQEGELERVGGSQTIKANVRIIAATNRNMEMEVKNGLVREDLWYRLNVFPITLPPLRQRKEDIPLLVNFFTNQFCKKLGKSIKTITPETLRALQDYSWPGNIRELANVIERAVINTQGTVFHLADKLQPSQTPNPLSNDKKSLSDLERDIILQRLEETEWKIEGPKGTARSLGLTPSTLRFRMTKLGIKRPEVHN